MQGRDYISKDEEKFIAREVIEFLRPKRLLIWQVKEILAKAAELVDWEEVK